MDPLDAAPKVAAWLTFWAGFAALDYYADKRGQSLSRSARHLFRTHHPAGRATFTLALTGGAVVLWRHITRTPNASSN